VRKANITATTTANQLLALHSFFAFIWLLQ
jgi:hypothetical protein